MLTEGNLKRGYTSGSHAVSALKVALLKYIFPGTEYEHIEITLPTGQTVDLQIKDLYKTDNYIKVNVIKSNNDDIDVTKGCEITCWLGNCLSEIPFNRHSKEHRPYSFEFAGINFHIWAGCGLGVVTKKGLKVLPGFPAINPVPLEMMKQVIVDVLKNNTLFTVDTKEIHIVYEVKDGELIAKDTNNPKVGIVGGISFLGKKGIVKPISSESYLESIKTEIDVAFENNSKTIVLTIGNSSFDFALKHYNLGSECFIEIGNFVFDTFKMLKKFRFEKICLVSNIGKLTKISQGKRNTNNRYGTIDFIELQKCLVENEFPEKLIEKCSKAATVAEFEEFVIEKTPDKLNNFYNILLNAAIMNINNWLNELQSSNVHLELVLTDGEALKASKYLDIVKK